MAFAERAIQVDVSRGRIPKLSTLTDRIETLRPFGLTGVFLYIECVVENPVLPAVGCGTTPITGAYLAALRDFCAERRIELTPILQVLGHQEKLLSLDEFERFGELEPPRNKGAGSNNFIPSPESRELLLRWIDGLLPLFNGRHVHLGCDEVFLLGKGRSAGMVAERGMAPVVADYLSGFAPALAARGRRAMIWSDMIIHFPELRDLLPREILLSNWGYGTYTEAYELDNRHFEKHAFLAEGGRRPWVFGNNMAEYVFTPLGRLRENTRIWTELAGRHGSGGYVISDWGSYWNVNPFVLSVLGDMYILLRLRNGGDLDPADFLDEFSAAVLGKRSADLREALLLMGDAQQNPAYFGERITGMAPHFGGMLFEDISKGGGWARRFGSVPDGGPLRFLEAMRTVERLLEGVDAGAARRPDWMHDLVMLANRLTALALKALLWQERIWDTGYIWDAPETDARRRGYIREYLLRARRDIAWYDGRWREENLESERAVCIGAMQSAADDMERVFGRG